MKTITVPAAVESLDTVRDFIDGVLEAYDCMPKVQFQIDIAVEEIFVNIASYAYQPGTGNAEIGIDMKDDPLCAVISFADSGKPFDPLAKEDADTSPEAINNRVGGLGILIVKKSMDAMRYSYEDGKNILIIEKNLS